MAEEEGTKFGTLAEIAYAPENFKVYHNDESALKAELDLHTEITIKGAEYWTDPLLSNSRQRANFLYHDGNITPTGALPPDLVEWNRIHLKEVKGCSTPCTFLGESAGQITSSLVQGQLANCWFLNALATLTAKPEFLKRIIVSDKFANEGLYTCKFYKRGEPVYVHVDDCIPCNRTGAPIFVTCKNKNVVYAMIIEKAYAKLHGSYLNLLHGSVAYGLRDLTGGVSFNLDLPFPPKARVKPLRVSSLPKPERESVRSMNALWVNLKEKIRSGLFSIGATCYASGVCPEERGLGVYRGHTYTIVSLHDVENTPGGNPWLNDGNEPGANSLRLVRVLDPWGVQPWEGDWKNKDKLWTDFPDAREQIHPDAWEDDGTFYINWKDFCIQFDRLSFVTPLTEDWRCSTFWGTWSKRSQVSSSGGCPNKDTWARNPMIPLSLPERTEVGIVLEQVDERFRKFVKVPSLSLGLHVCRLSKGKKRAHVFDRRRVVADSEPYRRSRQVACFGNLVQGEYCIVPSQFTNQTEGKFRVQVYTCDAKRGGQRASFAIQLGDTTLSLEAMPPEPDSDDENDTSITCIEAETNPTGEDMRSMEDTCLDGMQRLLFELAEQTGSLSSDISKLEDEVNKIEESILE